MAAAASSSLSSDVFEEIVMAEERFHGEGYQEGYAEGRHLGVVEGRRYGSLHGAKMGSEIGSYLGFALTWQCLLQKRTDEKNSKKLRALDSLIVMIQKFPYEDPTYDKLQEDLEKIRGKFKQEIWRPERLFQNSVSFLLAKASAGRTSTQTHVQSTHGHRTSKNPCGRPHRALETKDQTSANLA
ncbi:protein LTO1 homolog isoform X1 [Calypte anna]|uniref:protein LTO1 homolog isoform X1 n=1 Tax=Calypte anna TaxID=9244 RepID=UPI0011C3B3F6|nr:protein LTO1 homolog isoform X1 [Calypte anna]